MTLYAIQICHHFNGTRLRSDLKRIYFTGFFQIQSLHMLSKQSLLHRESDHMLSVQFCPMGRKFVCKSDMLGWVFFNPGF